MKINFFRWVKSRLGKSATGTPMLLDSPEDFLRYLGGDGAVFDGIAVCPLVDEDEEIRHIGVYGRGEFSDHLRAARAWTEREGHSVDILDLDDVREVHCTVSPHASATRPCPDECTCSSEGGPFVDLDADPKDARSFPVTVFPLWA